MLGTVLLADAAALLLYMLVLWLVSRVVEDVSIIDIAWGLGLVLVALIAYGLGAGDQDRRLLLVVLVSLWGLRLSGHLLVRKRSAAGEDPRYGGLRARYGRHFPMISLVVVFLFQGALIWMVSLPVQVAAGRPERLGPVDGIGVAVVVIGLLFEIVGDEELRRFKADPRHRANGAIMTAGLWRYTRHPNYFGDAMVWWGVYVIALSTGWAWWTIVSPVMMSFLLISVSGKKLLESRLIDRPGYRDYVAATSGFFPLPPRRSSR